MPEKDDMECLNSADRAETASPRAADEGQLASVLADIDRKVVAGPSRMELPLRCVASGYLADGCSCRATIPAAAVVAAWARELEREGGDRFFHFYWREGMWLGYGLEDGLVRGVYCPTHSSERDERSFSYSSRESAASRQVAVTA
jgi:hypothetical protein